MYIDESTMTMVDEKSSVNFGKTKKKTLNVEQDGYDKKETIMLINEDRSIRKLSIYTKDET